MQKELGTSASMSIDDTFRKFESLTQAWLNFIHKPLVRAKQIDIEQTLIELLLREFEWQRPPGETDV